MFLSYGKKYDREPIQRLTFKAENFTDASIKAKKLFRLIKKCGNFKSMWLLAVAKENTLKRYASMPSAIGYFVKDQPDFIKKAVKQAKKNIKNPIKQTKLKKHKPISYVDMGEIRVRT